IEMTAKQWCRVAISSVGVALLGALVAATSPASAQSAESGPLACTWNIDRPSLAGGAVGSFAHTVGCSSTSFWHAELQWRGQFGIWVTKDEVDWNGNRTPALIFRCNSGETESYRAIIDHQDGQSKPSLVSRLKCP
ncbi:MAG: hypothetical protein ABR528_05385, partial [Pseudonocardiaceae bacterium]